MFIKINNWCYWIHTATFNESSKINYLYLHFVYNKLCWTYFVRIFREFSVLTNDIVLKADGNYLSELSTLLSLSTFSPIWFCDTLIKLYICNDKIHSRKSKVLNFFEKLKFDEKVDIAMALEKHVASDVFKTYLGLARALENLRENIYVGQQQQKQ